MSELIEHCGALNSKCISAHTGISARDSVRTKRAKTAYRKPLPLAMRCRPLFLYPQAHNARTNKKPNVLIVVAYLEYLSARLLPEEARVE